MRVFARSVARHVILRSRKLKKELFFPLNYIFNAVEYNNVLNEREQKQGKIVLRSYPRYLGVNTSAVCNQKCVCCYYDADRVKSRNFLEPELFARMKWLRFVERIDLFGYMGDPLVNPWFPEIVEAVREVAPSSTLGIFTNGLALHGKNLEACLTLDSVHVSLNAASREVYEDFTHGNFDRVMENLREFARRKKAKTFTELSMVLLRTNASDVKNMIDLAAELRFNRVVITFALTTPETAALNVKDEIELIKNIRLLRGYAQSLGTDLYFPDPTRIGETCAFPWIHSYIGVDVEGYPFFSQCCWGGIKTSLYLKDADAYVDFRKRVWNHPRLVEIRRTVNLEPSEQNAMCYLCRSVDKTQNGWQDKIQRMSALVFKKAARFDGDFWPCLWEKVMA